MSFDICLERDRDGKSAPWRRGIVEEIFGRYIVFRDEDHGFIRLEFPDGSGSDICGIAGGLARRPLRRAVADALCL
jgi:hypothetical protein